MKKIIDDSDKYKNEVYFLENVTVEENVVIYNNVRISDSVLERDCVIGEDSVLNNCQIGNYCKLNRNTMLGNTKIGDYTYAGMRLTAFHSLIGKFCSISWNVTIGGANHDYNKLTTHAMLYNKQFGMTDTPLYDRFNNSCVIGNDVWIGAGAQVLRGTNIGDGAVIAAGAVVTRDVEPYSIMAGVPAKKIGQRFNNTIIDKLEEIKWWDFDSAIIKENITLFNEVPGEYLIKKLIEIKELNCR